MENKKHLRAIIGGMLMKVKNIIFEDLVNYKKPSMFIGTSKCNSFKCDKECGSPVCQNSHLAKSPTIEISAKEVVQRYIDNPITEAIVIGGLEPFDTCPDLYSLIIEFREKTDDDIVIYTGYYPDEISHLIEPLKIFSNIIIKFGRFIPNQESHYDEVLGVTLASPNQYAVNLKELTLK
jgi:organic radical activating enzyme